MRAFIPILALLFTGCGLDPLLFSTTDESPLPVLPSVQPNVLAGYVTSLPGAKVHLVGPSGQEVTPPVVATEQGAFSFELPGNSDFTGLHVVAESGTTQLWALAPTITPQESVLNGIRTIPMDQVPGMEDFTTESTALSFILLHRSGGIPLASETLLSASSSALDGINEVPELVVFTEMVQKILEATDKDMGGESPFDPSWTGSPATSPLRDAFLVEGVDYAGDEALETTNSPFNEALKAASEALSFDTCTAQDWIRVAFMVNLNSGLQDGNCDPLDPHLWASEGNGKQVFFTGGIHLDTPQCTVESTGSCIASHVSDAAHLELAAWEPNVVPMYDDGTHGDPVAGDGIWTRTFVLPWIPLEGDASSRGVRVGYKYTYGQPGALWTDTEEWPGNQRILEIADLDGDGVVVRYDYFGDEASNKDKKNLLSFANGGCGSNKWPEEMSDNCHSDVWENGNGFEGNCGGDTTPPMPTVAPVTCGEAADKMEDF